MLTAVSDLFPLPLSLAELHQLNNSSRIKIWVKDSRAPGRHKPYKQKQDMPVKGPIKIPPQAPCALFKKACEERMALDSKVPSVKFADLGVTITVKGKTNPKTKDGLLVSTAEEWKVVKEALAQRSDHTGMSIITYETPSFRGELRRGRRRPSSSRQEQRSPRQEGTTI